MFLVGEVEDFVRRIPEYQARLSAQITPFEPWLAQFGFDARSLTESGSLSSRAIAKQALSLSGLLLNHVGSMSVILLLLLILALDAPGFNRTLEGRLPTHRQALRRYRAFQREVQIQYRVATFSNLLSAAALTATYVAFRLDFALLWGVLSFFLSYVPRFGMLLSFAPPVLMALLQFGAPTAGVVLLGGLIVNTLMSNVATPRLTHGVNLRASVVAIGAMIWVWVFGPLGALLSVSLTLFIRMLLASSPVTRPLAYLMSTEAYAAPEDLPPPEPPSIPPTPDSR